MLGAQDTLFAGKGPNGRVSRQYFSNCYIEGLVAFMVGNAKPWFRQCELHGIANQLSSKPLRARRRRMRTLAMF
ncbi:pectinesterase family protein [Bradyrhizobium sacchari]|uniref:pectinesterase family protein n=1 Tax=Bradyrhizobium sacchari TaxID=1399419 RepID=UPI001FD935FF|nr:pectinesterase family protein [Bradyrhizobium sacchari]